MKIFKILILMVLPFCMQAQDMEGGLFAGISQYQGDLVDSYVEMKETNLAYGAFLRYYVHDKVAVKLNFNGGRISGNDANSKAWDRRARGIKFQSDIYELGINGEWHIFGRYRYEDMKGIFKHISPYLSIGVAVAYTDPRVEGEGIPEVEEYKKSFLSIPVGGGFNFDIYDNIALGLEGGFRPAFSDYLDGVSLLGNPGRNDWYVFGGFTLTFAFGGDYY